MTGQPALSAEAVPPAAARTTARNARDKNDLLDLLAALALPSDEDTVTALLPLLGEAQPVVTASPAPLLPPRQPHPCPKENHQVNAYRAVVLSMNRDGYSDQQIADELKVSIEEVTQTIDAAKADQSGQPPAPAEPTEETAPAPAEETASVLVPEPMPGVDELLAWAAAHDDTAVRADGEQAAAVLAALRERRQVDAELEQITSEATQLEKRLTELRTRENELRPAATNKKQQQRDYEPGEVRAWARQNGYTVPERTRIPKDVLTAWRARHAPQLQAAS